MNPGKARKTLRKQARDLRRAIANNSKDEVQTKNEIRRRLKPKGLTGRD